MNRVKNTTCIFLLITTPLLAVAAQNSPAQKAPNQQATAEKRKLENPLLQKITSVLDQVLEAQKSFSDETQRVMVQAQIADTLWGYDEPRARRLFAGCIDISEKLTDQGTPAPQAGGVLPYPAREAVTRTHRFRPRSCTGSGISDERGGGVFSTECVSSSAVHPACDCSLNLRRSSCRRC